MGSILTTSNTLSTSSISKASTNQTITQRTNQLVDKWEKRHFLIHKVAIWSKPLKGVVNEILSATLGGIAHSFALIESPSSTFLLDKLEEGVRFKQLTDEQVIEYKKGTTKVCEKDGLKISSTDIAVWITQQQKIGYSRWFNCNAFAIEFCNKFADGILCPRGICKALGFMVRRLRSHSGRFINGRWTCCHLGLEGIGCVET
eukprot:311428_1